MACAVTVIAVALLGALGAAMRWRLRQIDPLASAAATVDEDELGIGA